jgi:hypothetical protein
VLRTRIVIDHYDRFDPARLRPYALENLPWDRVAAGTVDVYREVLDGRRPTP